jgi:hypothetical protein
MSRRIGAPADQEPWPGEDLRTSRSAAARHERGGKPWAAEAKQISDL